MIVSQETSKDMGAARGKFIELISRKPAVDNVCKHCLQLYVKLSVLTMAMWSRLIATERALRLHIDVMRDSY